MVESDNLKKKSRNVNNIILNLNIKFLVCKINILKYNFG